MRLQHLVTLLVLLALAVASAPTPAHAGGVVTVCDEANLLGALAGGGTVTFSCSGTITLTATITIATDTTIDGSGQTVTISGNHAVRVFRVNSGVTLNLSALTVANGRAATGDGGGINNSGTLNVNHSTFSGNGANWAGGSNGGGINNSGTVTASNSTFIGNNASSSGGGIYNAGGTLIVSNSIFSNNSTGINGGGGGICNSGTVAVSNSTFTGNSAFGGAGIANYDPGTLTVINTSFSGNNASGLGGCAFQSGGGGILSSGTLIVSNSTFSGNSTGGNRYGGGGIFSWGTVTVSNSTFAGNRASNGGGIYTESGPLTLKNTIVANSPAGGNCSGAVIDGGGNLSYPDATCPGINSDPVLGPLQDNGGPTHTMTLFTGSAALDAADDAICAAAPVNNRDQRGITRPQGPHCDIGAYEALPPRAYLPLIMR